MHARTLTTLLLLLAALGPASPARAQTTLDLGRTARVPADEPIRLGAVATLEGERAGELAGLILVEDPETYPTDEAGWSHIGIGLVRETVEARLGNAAGLVAIRGSACDVRVLGRRLHAVEAPADKPAEPISRNADGLVSLETVRGSIARELSRILRTPPEDLRLTFSSADNKALDTPTTGRVVQIGPIGSSPRMPVQVSVYEPDRLVLRESVRVGVEVRRGVAVMRRALARRAVIGPEDFAAETRWVAPTDRFASPDAVLGAVAARSLSPGEPVEARSIETPLLVRKGDLVMVRVILDGLVLRRAANAREDGHEGDIIEFSPRHDPRSRFRATVIGSGEAQVWTFGEPAASRGEPGTPVALE